MTALTFTGAGYSAAKYLLANTSLGTSLLARHVTDDGKQLAITPDPETLWSLSSGEHVLWDWLCSFAGKGEVHLTDLLARLDPQAAFAAWWSLGVALDKVAPFPHPLTEDVPAPSSLVHLERTLRAIGGER